MSDNEDHETYGWIVMADPIGGFVFIVVTLIVCYAKRWCCFAVSQVTFSAVYYDQISLFSVAQTSLGTSMRCPAQG